jgi:hypothetical protein
VAILTDTLGSRRGRHVGLNRAVPGHPGHRLRVSCGTCWRRCPGCVRTRVALSGLPADEREDVIAGIREHVDDSLLAIADPTPVDVRRVLDELGDPLAIAADAGAGTAA